MRKVVKSSALITLPKILLFLRFDSVANIVNVFDARNCVFNLELVLKCKKKMDISTSLLVSNNLN